MSQDWNSPGAPPPPPSFGQPPPPPGGFSPYNYGGGPNGGSQGAFPWDERSRRGFVDALVASCKMLITEPTRAFSLLKPDGDMTGPLLFGLIISWPITILGQLYGLVFGGMMSGMLGGVDGLQAQAFGGTMQMLATIVLYPLLYLIIVFVLAGLYHLALIVTKGLASSSFGFDGTVKVVCYANIASLAGIVPFIGGIISLIVMIILAIIGLQTVHRTSIGNAAVAVLLPLGLCCVCIVVAFFAFGAAIAAAIAGAAGG